jgi:hypothetical protein
LRYSDNSAPERAEKIDDDLLDALVPRLTVDQGVGEDNLSNSPIVKRDCAVA